MEYFEQLSVGDSDSFGAYEVRREEVTTFAAQYDPQPVHTDPDAAAASMFGELVASGWHTAAMTMRLLVDHRLADSGAMGAVGVDELRWPEPVRPGDTLSVRTTVTATEPVDDERGYVDFEVTSTTDAGDVVLSMVPRVVWQRE
jgi:acyl dehydratase